MCGLLMKTILIFIRHYSQREHTEDLLIDSRYYTCFEPSRDFIQRKNRIHYYYTTQKDAKRNSCNQALPTAILLINMADFTLVHPCVINSSNGNKNNIQRNPTGGTLFVAIVCRGHSDICQFSWCSIIQRRSTTQTSVGTMVFPSPIEMARPYEGASFTDTT